MRTKRQNLLIVMMTTKTKTKTKKKKKKKEKKERIQAKTAQQRPIARKQTEFRKRKAV